MDGRTEKNRKEFTMYQLGTVAEYKSLHLPIPEEVKRKVSEVAVMLDEQFGANRDVKEDKGGFIFIALERLMHKG